MSVDVFYFTTFIEKNGNVRVVETLWRKKMPNKIGKVPWNVGLTKETDERVKKYCDSRDKTLKEHPEIILKAVEKRKLTLKEHPEIQKQNNEKHSKILQENPEIMSRMVETRRERGNYRQTEKSREKIRKIVLEQFKNGMPSETVEKIRKSNLGKHIHSEDWKKKMREMRSKQIFPVKDTKIEVKIQNFLKQLGIDFFTHQHIKEIEHGYQCDVLIPSINLVIECDGNYWHKYPLGNEIDHIRTSELLKNGFKVLRLWECEINKMELNDFKERLNEIKTN